MTGTVWDDPETVERFATREPDHRLLHLIPRFDHPGATRVLDLGCAAGRNTELLAHEGFDVWALDASEPMVRRTRSRVAAALGRESAEDRVRVGRMDDLTLFADGSFDLVVALGVYHNARTRAEWLTALSETARVTAPGGLVLVNQFTPEVDLTGEGTRPVPDEPDVYEGLPGGNAVLVTAPSLDAAFGSLGLDPAVPSTTVRIESGRGRRVSVNALYRKPGGDPL